MNLLSIIKSKSSKFCTVEAQGRTLTRDYSMKDQKVVNRRKWLNNNGGDRDDYHSLGTGESEGPVTKDVLNLKMLVGTWNVNGKSPHEKLDLGDWLGTGHPDPPAADIYVLGFQEIVPLNAGNVLLGASKNNTSNGPAAMWLSLIDQFLNKHDDDQGTGTPSSFSEEFERNKHRSNSSEKDSSTSRSSRRSPPPPPREMSTTSRRRSRHKYCLVASKQMVGIFLCVWIRSDLDSRHVNQMKISCVGTGIMGCLGNKGSVCISMSVHGVSFCFVCTHLASGEKEGDEVRRNSDVADILRKTKFTHSSRGVPGQPLPPQHILDHDKIIWLGDLNYRIIASDHDNASELLQKNDWQAALERDQLMAEQRAGRVFKGWEEGVIEFAPTYKYRDNSDQYAFHFRTSTSPSNNASKRKSRFPAWCDRILWKGEGLKQSAYNRGENKFSDHRPVYAQFCVQLAPSKSCSCCCNSNVGRTTRFRTARAAPSNRTTVIPKNKVHPEELLMMNHEKAAPALRTEETITGRFGPKS